MRRERLMKAAKRIYLMLIFSKTVPTAQYYAAGSIEHRPNVRMGVQRHWILLNPHCAAEPQPACSRVDSPA